MIRRILMGGLGVAGMLAAMAQPASAQIVDDFLCSSFSYKCNQAPPLPPPQLAPGNEPAPGAEKHARVVKKHKVKHAAVAKKDDTKDAPPPEPASK